MPAKFRRFVTHMALQANYPCGQTFGKLRPDFRVIRTQIAILETDSVEPSAQLPIGAEKSTYLVVNRLKVRSNQPQCSNCGHKVRIGRADRLLDELVPRVY